MILLDTSVLADALTGSQRLGSALRSALENGPRMGIPSLVLFEWRRGPRLAPELALQEAPFPSEETIRFGPAEAILAAELRLSVRRSPDRARLISRQPRAQSRPVRSQSWRDSILNFPGRDSSSRANTSGSGFENLKPAPARYPEERESSAIQGQDIEDRDPIGQHQKCCVGIVHPGIPILLRQSDCPTNLRWSRERMNCGIGRAQEL